MKIWVLLSSTKMHGKTDIAQICPIHPICSRYSPILSRCDSPEDVSYALPKCRRILSMFANIPWPWLLCQRRRPESWREIMQILVNNSTILSSQLVIILCVTPHETAVRSAPRPLDNIRYPKWTETDTFLQITPSHCD